MKKSLALVLSLVLALGTSITAFAADASTNVTYETPLPPSYTVTIPSTIALSLEKGDGTNFDATLTNIPSTQKVKVTVADAKYPENNLGVQGSVYETLAICSYDLTTLKYKVELADGL